MEHTHFNIDDILKTGTGRIPAWLMRTVKQAGKGINRFGMVSGGDRVLLAVSGGKDSLVLAFCLALRLKWLPVKYGLYALHVNWRQYPVPETLLEDISNFFSALGIPFESRDADMMPDSFRGKFNCYLCARNRKRILFEYAEEKGINRIATGHHLDDIAETTLINLCLRGNFSTMMPVQDFFGGRIKIIRPLCMVRESSIELVSKRLELPVYNTVCPYRETNLRLKMKPVMKQLYQLDRNVYQHIFDAPWKINPEYLPGNL